MERTTPNRQGLSDYQRGWHDGAQAIVRLTCANMRAARQGARRTITLDRFDSLVERHLERVGLPPDPQGLSDNEMRRIVAEHHQPGQDT